jgi:translocation and assembly module TamA
VRLGRTQDTERIERLYFVEWQRAMTRNLGSGLITDDTKAATVNYHWVWRDLDHPILPTRGFSLSAETALGHSYASTDTSGFFTRATGRLTGYWPLGASWYGQGRVQLGQVYARDAVAVPFTLLFRAGGDDSVRGYGYQTLGPTDASGSAVGGRVLGTGSIELARPFSRSLPAWWGAVFLDGGNAAERWSDFKNVYGAGFGVRWRSPVGPLRIDMAWGDQNRRWRLHFNVGVTF